MSTWIQSNDTIDIDHGEMLDRENREKIRKVVAKNLEVVDANSDPVHPSRGIYVRWIKRGIDIGLSLIALLVTFPVNLILAICTFFDVGRPIFFKQKREGRNCQPFTIIKFRNMNNKKDEFGNLLPGKDRVTKFGKFVRMSSLDELLNFWSILKGDMSLIGPRPLVMEYTNYLSARHRQRYAVRPGLECPMMIPLDEEKSWGLQFENDVWYVEHVSFITDIRMLVALFKMTFNRKTSKMRGGATRGSFVGYNPDGTSINSKQVPIEYVKEVLGEIKDVAG